MNIFSFYIKSIKRNGKAHIIFTLAASLLVTVRVMIPVMTFLDVSPLEFAVYSLCPFLSMALFWLPCASPIKSPLWLYRVGGIYLFVNMGYSKVADYLCSELYEGSHHLKPWFMMWFKPFYVCAAVLAGHRLLSWLAEKGFKPCRLYRLLLLTVQPAFSAEKSEKPMSVPKKILLVLGCVLMSLSALFLTATAFLHLHFPSMDIEAIIFTVQFANDGYTPDMARKLILYACIAAALAVMLCIRLVRMTRSDKLRFDSPNKKPAITAGARATRIAVWVVIPVFSVTALFLETGTFSYIKNRLSTSQLYEDHYVKPSSDNITFPGKKKNLIYIYLESFENSYSTAENGGLQDQDMMPQLTELAKNNLNFSHNDKLGGSIVRAPSIAYTMGATIAQTSGVVLMTPLGKMRNNMGELQSFLPSLTRLEDVLHDNGYEQLYIEGSDSNFAAYNSYVGRYDDSNIFDLNSAREQGLISKDYFKMWGFEDAKLFEFSKMKIDELAKGDKPFAVTMYTMDTHSFEEGYRCELCDNRISNRFAAAVDCVSRQVGSFIDWLKTQPYYDDTVIVITGDHIAEHVPDGIELEKDGYERSPYNCFINAQKTPENSKNRVFSPMDMFPTTLSAMGAEIKGDRLGLGTDLFSGRQTLAEEIGREEFTKQIQQNSKYFNEQFWKDAS